MSKESDRKWKLKVMEFCRAEAQDELETMEERETLLLATIADLDARIERHRDTDIVMKARHRTAVEDYAVLKETPGPSNRITSPPGVIGKVPDPPLVVPEPEPEVGVFYHGKWDNLENWVKEWDPKQPTGEVKGENDPNGTAAHTAGAKMDAGKPLSGSCIAAFVRALQGVINVYTYGAEKYCKDGWEKVPDGENRYRDALYRHLLDHEKTPLDSDSGMPHLAHACWNLLAWSELVLRRQEREQEMEAEATSGGTDVDAGC